jgi:hypothetical protein
VTESSFLKRSLPLLGPDACRPAGAREDSMAAASRDTFLDPVDLSQHLDKIGLYLGQVCQVAGISKMQLDYWTERAGIPTKGRKQRIYDREAIETVMLIKQARDRGLSLATAIEAARRFQDETDSGSAE